MAGTGGGWFSELFSTENVAAGIKVLEQQLANGISDYVLRDNTQQALAQLKAQERNKMLGQAAVFGGVGLVAILLLRGRR